MALLLDASGELVNHGSNAAVDGVGGGACTILAWVKIVTDGYDRVIASKTSGIGTNGFKFHIEGEPTDPFTGRGAIRFLRGGSGTQELYLSNYNRVLASQGWRFVAVACSAFTTAGGTDLFYGGLTEWAIEEASYVTTTDGSGTYGSDAASDLIAGNVSGGGEFLAGHLARLAIYNRKFTLAQVREHQFDWWPRAGCKLLIEHDRAGKQFDQSGFLNHGTITGATLSEHMPLRQRGADGYPYPLRRVGMSIAAGSTFGGLYYQHYYRTVVAA